MFVVLLRFAENKASASILTDVLDPFALDPAARRAFWRLIIGRVFDRFPELTLVLSEVRVDWLPSTLAFLDEFLEKNLTSDNRPAMKPSEYWERNGMACASSIHRSEVELRHEIGVKHIMFGADYPHFEGTWPNTRAWVQDAFADIPLEEARRILGTNAIRVYGLDEAGLNDVARRIDADVSIFTGAPVPPELVGNFHERAGYLRPAETADVIQLRQLVGEDLVAIGSR